jgi:cystathionine beta-lyase/cystathionine gamma-synthase
MAMVRFGYANASAELKKRFEHLTWFKVALSLADVNTLSVSPKQAQLMA